MKTLPGLPAVPPRFEWKVEALPNSGAFHVTLWENRPGEIPRFRGSGYTRSWPKPGAAQVVRAACKIARRHVIRLARESSPLIGTYPSRESS